MKQKEQSIHSITLETLFLSRLSSPLPYYYVHWVCSPPLYPGLGWAPGASWLCPPGFVSPPSITRNNNVISIFTPCLYGEFPLWFNWMLIFHISQLAWECLGVPPDKLQVGWGDLGDGWMLLNVEVSKWRVLKAPGGIIVTKSIFHIQSVVLHRPPPSSDFLAFVFCQFFFGLSCFPEQCHLLCYSFISVPVHLHLFTLESILFICKCDE